MRASIVTPVFNGARHIEACVATVAGQGDAVLEHIVADGGSTDGTCELLARLASAHPRLRVLHGPDQGQSDAMNKGTMAARGEVIGILNVDDCYMPGAVQRGVAELMGFDRPGVVVGDCLVVRADGTSFWNRPRDLRLEALLHDFYLAPLPANPSAYFYHREVHDIAGGFDVSDHFAMDAEFLLRCAASVPMRYVQEHWGEYRFFPGTKTFEDTQGPERVASILRRHSARLTAAQRRRKRRIWYAQQAEHFLRRALRRVGVGRDL